MIKWSEPNDPTNFNARVFGVDPATPDGDKTGLFARIAGCTFICEVPKGLGTPTKLEVRNGRVLCQTESGITMIVPGAERAD